MSGPLVGLSVSSVLFTVGLFASINGDMDVDPTLVPVPSQLFQGSFLLGALSRVVSSIFHFIFVMGFLMRLFVALDSWI